MSVVVIWSSSSILACMVNWGHQSLINSNAEIEITLAGKHAFYLTCLSIVMHDHAKADVVCLLAHVSSWVACKTVVTTMNRVRLSSLISKPPLLITQRSIIVFLLEEKMRTIRFRVIRRSGAEVPIPLNLILACFEEGCRGELRSKFQALLPWGCPDVHFIQQIHLSKLKILLPRAL